MFVLRRKIETILLESAARVSKSSAFVEKLARPYSGGTYRSSEEKDGADQKRLFLDELLLEEIEQNEDGDSVMNKPAHLEARAQQLRDDARALLDAAELSRHRIERHRKMRTRALETRASDLREEARDLERKASVIREDEDFGGKYYRSKPPSSTEDEKNTSSDDTKQ